MAISVVIGAGTTVVFGDQDACFISANWGFNPGRTDAFCLGDFNPSAEHVLYKPTQTLSLTGYAPVRSRYDIPPSAICEDAGTLEASVSPATCDIVVDDISGDWWLQSYGYSKETKDQPAQETWGLIKYKGGVEDFLTSQGVALDRIALPSYVMRGITMGESTENVNWAQTGIHFVEIFAEAQTGSVSAGGFGKVTETTHGSVEAVGGGSSDNGFKGNGSASIPYTPLYI